MEIPNQNRGAALRAEHMGLYPTLDSLDAVVDMAIAQVPLVNRNDMRAILMVYHNTMLRVMGKEHVAAIN